MKSTSLRLIAPILLLLAVACSAPRENSRAQGERTTVAANTEGAANPIPYGSNQEVGKYIRVNDIRLYYETFGAGHPLLLMHGNGGSIAGFSKLIPYLAKHYQVIAVDSRAQGRSEDSDRELTFELIASDMAALLDALKLSDVYAVGWSDGGIVGLQLAYAYPKKVAKLVTSGANFVADSTALPAEFVDPAKVVWFRNLDATEKQRVVDESRFPERAGVIYDKLINLDLKYPNFTMDQLGKIQTPTMVVAGDHDIILDAHTVKLFHALPHSELFIVPQSDHSVLIDRPELMSRMIAEFFDSPFKDMKKRGGGEPPS